MKLERATVVHPQNPGRYLLVLHHRELPIYVTPKPQLQPQPADGVALDHGQVDLVPEQVADVVDAVQDHGGPLLRAHVEEGRGVRPQKYGLHTARMGARVHGKPSAEHGDAACSSPGRHAPATAPTR